MINSLEIVEWFFNTSEVSIVFRISWVNWVTRSQALVPFSILGSEKYEKSPRMLINVSGKWIKESLKLVLVARNFSMYYILVLYCINLLSLLT